MKNVWVGTDWHVWSLEHTAHHPYQSVSNIRQLSDSYAKDIQVDDVFIYLGDLCDPAVTDLNELKMLISNIPGYKVLCKGNHDIEKDTFYKEIGFDAVCDICVIGQIVFSHKPIKVEPDQINIHGHLHTEKWSEFDDANHINAYTPDFYKHPLSITEILQNAYERFLKTPKISIESIDNSLKGYTNPSILDLTSEFDDDMLSESALLDEAPTDASISYLMSLSTVDTEEKLLKWVRQNLHVGPMGKVKTDMQMATSHVASDFDIALFVYPRLKKLGHSSHMMIFIGYEPKNPRPGFVHMFNYWTDMDDSVTWFEASWRGHEGIKEFDSMSELKEEILSIYNSTPEATKYTETIFRAVNPAYVKPGNDPQKILKNIFGETGLTESLTTDAKESYIIMNGVPEPYDTVASSVDWFCDMLQIPNQVINIKLLNNIRKIWAECIPGSSPFGGRGKDNISVLLDEKFIPEGFDKPSIKKFVCFFDILVTGDNNLTPDIASAIAYWYSQPYYDQCFNKLPEHLQPSKDVQKAFNTIQVYQRLMNDTAVDMLVRELYWNKTEDPKIIISSVAMNAVANTYGNQKTQYDNLLSMSETTYDLSKYTDLIIPGTTQRSPFNGKKITSFVDDLLDANIKITPETIDKIALKQVKSAQDLVDYYNSKLESFTDYSSGSYLGSADLLWTLLFNMNNFSINNWEKFIPTNLTETEFELYMNKRFAELDEIEKMYQDIMINNIGAMRLSEAMVDAKSELDAKDSKLCKVSTKKDGTVVYDYGKDLGKVFIALDVYNNDSDKFKTTVKPSRFFTRVHEYDYIILTHGKVDGNPNLWEIEHITVDKNACYMVSELLDDIGTDKKVLLLICNPKGRQISGKYKNVTYSTNYVLDESAIPSNLNIHDTIQTKISIIKTKIKQLQKINKRINAEAIKSDSSVEFGFIAVRNTNKKNPYPYLECVKENVDFRHKYTHFAINDYIYALESAKNIFKWMDKIYFESMPETGYYWTYQHSHCPIIMTVYDNPVIGGAVFSTIDECISDAKDYLDDIHGSGEYTINVYEAVKGHPLPGQRIRIDESTFIDSNDAKEGMTITVSEEEVALTESTTYDLSKYNKLYIPGINKELSPLSGKKLTSFIDDLLDANIKITPETIDKEALRQVKNAEDLVNYYNNRYKEYTNPNKNEYFGSAYILALLLYNLHNNKVNVWENFVPTGLSESEFASYMDKRFAELDEIELMYQRILSNNIGATKLSIAEAKCLMNDGSLCKVSTKKDGTVVYDYGKDLGKVYINAEIYRDSYKFVKPSRFFTRVNEYDYVIVTHGHVGNDPTIPFLWNIDHITIKNDAQYTVNEMLEEIGTKPKILLLICNPYGKKISGKFKNVTYAVSGDVLMESNTSLAKDINIHNRILDRVNIIKAKIKFLKSLSKSINKIGKSNIYDNIHHEYGFIFSDINVNDEYHSPRFKLVRLNNEFNFSYVNDTIYTYINMLEYAKVVFTAMDKIYFNNISETGYYWTYSPENVYIIRECNINPLVTGMVFDTIDECITDAKEYSGFEEYDPITNESNNAHEISIFKAIKGHPLPGYYKYLDESTCIRYGDYVDKVMINTSDIEDNKLNEILMEPEDAHLFLADDEAGEKSQKPYKGRLSTDDEGVLAEAVYNIDKYRKLYNFDEGKYKDSFRGDTKLTSLVEDLLDANIKVSPESIDSVALSNVKSAEELVKYFSERIDDLTESDSFIASGFIFATLLNNTNGSMNLEKFSDFVPTSLSEDEFSKYVEKRFSELKLIDSVYQEVLKNNIANYALGISLSSNDIIKAKAIIDSDKTIINTNYAPDTVEYSYGDGFATVFINKNIYNQYGSIALKPSRLYGRASMYDYIIITPGKSDPSSDKWKVEPITINRRTFTDAKSIVSYLGKNASVLFLTCNPDGKLIEGYPKLTYSTTNTLFEKVSLTKSYDMINKSIDHLNKRKRQLKTIYTIFDKWYHKHHPTSYPKYVYPQIEFIQYNKLTVRKVKFTDVDEFYSVGNSILRFINEYRDMLTKSIYILRLFVKTYYNLIPENGYYWIAERSNKKILTPGVSTINPFIVGNVSTLEECYQEILEFYENDDSLIEHWDDITIYKNHKNSDTICTNECTHTTFDSIINEDAYQLQGIDRDQQDVISKKYGIRAVGHETEEERELREKQEREAKERKRLAEKKKKDKQLAKARATKKKYAKKRELEAKRESFKSKFNKKNNEDVDISNIPYNDGSVNFFDNTPGVANFDFANESGYQFEMLDKIKFIDSINESADDRTLYPVYVLCVHTGTLLANAIKKATGSHFSHCTISFDSSLKNMYSFGRKVKMTELSNGSFVKESIHNPPYTNEGVNYALYCIPVTASQIAAMKKRLEYFVKNKTRFRYDFAGLFKNFFGIADNPEQRWFCSRFVADIINAGTEPGQKPLIREPSLMRPEDFLYTNFALYVTSGLIKDYDQMLVDKVTKKLLRIESIRRAQQRAVQPTNIPVTESAVLDLNPYESCGEEILSYQLTTMDENAFNDLKRYMKSFKIKLDKDGNIIIHRREVDQLDKYFREANQLLRMSKKANNQQGVIDQLCRVYYMINIIDRYYLNSTMTKNNTVKMDLKKELVDLRSVMLNVFQQYLKWITEQNPQFNFQKVYDNSIYSDTKVTIPKQIITDIGKAIVTLL